MVPLRSPSSMGTAARLAMPRRHAAGGRAGFTLIEILTVLAILSVVSFLLAQVVVKSIQLNRLAMGQLTQLITQSDLATKFRTDVGAASDRLDSLGSYQSGADTLILDYRPTKSPPRSAAQVIWQWDGSRLWRITWEDESPRRIEVSPEQRYRNVVFETEKQEEVLRVRARFEPYWIREPKALQEDQVEGWLRKREIVVEAVTRNDRR